MKLRSLFALALALPALFLLGGCEAADPNHSTLPQARPAQWEGVPAMVDSPGRYGY